MPLEGPRARADEDEMGDVVAVLHDDAMPAGRLGELLRAARKRRGWKRRDAAARVGITTAELRAFERGDLSVPTEVCGRLVDCYGDDLQVPMRTPVAVADLASGSEHETLTDYVRIVQRLRNAKPGEPLSLRADDLAALAAALDQDPETVEQAIMELLGCSRAEARTLHRELLRRKVVLSVAGLAAGVAAVAGVQSASASGNPATPPAVVAHAPTTAMTVASKKTVVVPARHRRRATSTTTTPTTSAPVMHPAPARQVPAEQRALPAAQADGGAQEAQGGWKPLPDPPAMPRPTIPYDDTPVTVPPGETPITQIGSAISTVPAEDAG
jgi:transcriptional regulator with XRE-family HTH domain